MIIELKNFGPIKYYKFDLDKDFHAIFGKNNIGKSYAISAVYLILKNLENTIYLIGKIPDKKDVYLDIQKKYESKLKEKVIENKKTTSVVITSLTQEFVTQFLSQTFLFDLKISFTNTFDNKTIENSQILIEDSNFFLTINITDAHTYICELKLKKEFIVEKVQTKKIAGAILSITETQIKSNYYIKEYPYVLKAEPLFKLEILVYMLLPITLRYEKFLFFPASRSGLYNALNTYSSLLVEMSKFRHLNTTIPLPNISEPIADYFSNLSNINDKVSDIYTKISSEMENKLLKGKVVFDNESKKLYYYPDSNKQKLELGFSSSMISELAPIVAHFKYILSKKKASNFSKYILFIEEPEAHLHPEIQVVLLEYFIKMLDYDVKIVMTSHSNYILNKLSNLVLAKQADPTRLSISLMEMTENGSVQKDGAMNIDEWGISDDNFVDIAEQLYEERMKLYEEKNKLHATAQ